MRETGLVMGRPPRATVMMCTSAAIYQKDVGAGTLLEGVTCVGDVNGTVVAGLFCVGKATDCTGIIVRS